MTVTLAHRPADDGGLETVRAFPFAHILLWTAAAASVAGALTWQEYQTRAWTGGPRSFGGLLLAQLLGLLVWLVLIPLVIAPVTRRLPLRREGLPRVAVIHLGAGLVLAALQAGVLAGLLAFHYYGYSPLAAWDIFRDRLHTGYALNVLFYLVVAAVFTLRAEPPLPEVEATQRGAARWLRRLLVKEDGRTTVLPVTQIDWMEADDNNVIVHAGKARHAVRGPLNALASRLPPARFSRIHRSTVVNLEAVREVQPWYHGDLVAVLRDETRLKVGRTYHETFLAALEG